jgi:hypothetical protein
MQHLPGMESMLHTLMVQVWEQGMSVCFQVVYPQDLKALPGTMPLIK